MVSSTGPSDCRSYRAAKGSMTVSTPQDGRTALSLIDSGELKVLWEYQKGTIVNILAKESLMQGGKQLARK